MSRRAPTVVKQHTASRGKSKKQSGVDATQLQSRSHTVNRQHIGGDAVVDAVEFGIADHLVESAIHHVEEALVDFAFAPEKALAVLNPLEVTHGDAAGIPENIGDGENALGVDDGVGLPGGGAVGAFAEDLGLDLMGVLLGDLVFDGGGNRTSQG